MTAILCHQMHQMHNRSINEMATMVASKQSMQDFNSVSPSPTKADLAINTV
jgi:hypothetical protein